MDPITQSPSESQISSSPLEQCPAHLSKDLQSGGVAMTYITPSEYAKLWFSIWQEASVDCPECQGGGSHRVKPDVWRDCEYCKATGIILRGDDRWLEGVYGNFAFNDQSDGVCCSHCNEIDVKIIDFDADDDQFIYTKCADCGHREIFSYIGTTQWEETGPTNVMGPSKTCFLIKKEDIHEFIANGRRIDAIKHYLFAMIEEFHFSGVIILDKNGTPQSHSRFLPEAIRFLERTHKVSLTEVYL